MFRIVWSDYAERIKLNLVLIVQIVIILVLTNMIVSSINGRYMLYKPFEKIIKHEGAMFRPCEDLFLAMLDFTEDDIQNMCQGIKGKADIHMSYNYTDTVNIGNKNKDIAAYFMGDEFIEGLKLPLADGSWQLQENENYIPCIISPNPYGIKTGDYIKTNHMDVKYKVMGVLTDITYEPRLSSWAANVNGMFESYNVKGAERLFIITKYSLAGEIKNVLRPELGVFIDYKDGLTEEEIISNNTILLNKGQFVTYRKIREASELYIYKDLRDLFPVIIGAVIVICIGIISAVSVATESRFKQYRVFYLCGATKRNCILINVMSTTITLIISALLSLSIILIYRNISNATELAIIVNRYNLLISAAILVVFEIMASIIPAVLIGKKSIKELMYD